MPSIQGAPGKFYKTLEEVEVPSPFPDYLLWDSSSRYYAAVPKHPLENARFRRALLVKALDDPEFMREWWCACRRDVLFFFNTMLWTFDPRMSKMGTKDVPFVTYGAQDDAILRGKRAIDAGRNLLWEKSRDQGATWIVCGLYLHYWLFEPYSTFTLASRKEDLVDRRDDPDTLFWKLDYLLKSIPGFARPKFERSSMKLLNLENGSIVNGESTNKDIGRGGRRKGAAVDEFASVPDGEAVMAALQKNSPSCFWISTPKGPGNAFARMRKKNQVEVVQLHWSRHPRQRVGLYIGHPKDGTIRIIDEKFRFPKNYPFKCDGQLRSPYFDNEERKDPNPLITQQELNLNYDNSVSQFFGSDLFTDEFLTCIRPPLAYATLLYDRSPEGRISNPRMVLDPNGPVALWCEITPDGKLVGRVDGVVAGDVSQGLGSSNSVAVAGDRRTKEKFLEYVNPNISPEDFGDVMVALSLWCGPANDSPLTPPGALLVWEINGPGRNALKRVLQTDYRNVWCRRSRTDTSAPIPTDQVGWHSSDVTKLQLLGSLRNAYRDRLFLNPSEQAIEELKSFIFNSDGRVYHAAAMDTYDPSGARENHGDRVIADALLWMIFETTTPIPLTAAPVQRLSGFGLRFAEWQSRMARAEAESVYFEPEEAGKWRP
jgi:hypothetical protein